MYASKMLSQLASLQQLPLTHKVLAERIMIGHSMISLISPTESVPETACVVIIASFSFMSCIIIYVRDLLCMSI